MGPVVSVIIPAYKVAKYLHDCVGSVLSQTYSNLEVILVNDGSPDSCGVICDEFAKKDNRVKVIHKDNGGLSDARNTGVKNATGEYVIFLDGDDLWGDTNALQRLMQRQNQVGADVLNYSYVCWFEETDQKQPYFERIDAMPMLENKKEQLRYLTEKGLYIASACNKLIRRSVLENLEFRRGVYSEDIEWCAKLMLKAGSLDFACENFYLYRQHTTSIRYTITDQKCRDLVNNIALCLELLQQAPEDTREALLHYIAFQFGTFFIVQSQAETEPTECIEQMNSYSWLLEYHGNRKKLWVLYILCKVMGYKRACKLVRMAYRRVHL